MPHAAVKDTVPNMATATQSRQTKSMLAGRARRQRESSLILEIGHTLPLTSIVAPEYKDKPLGKPAILKLATSFIKFKGLLGSIGLTPRARTSEHGSHFYEDALGEGFVFALLRDGTIVYTSLGTLNGLGRASVEFIGTSIYEWTNSEDRPTISRLLAPIPLGTRSSSPRSERLRFKLSEAKQCACEVNGKMFQSQGGVQQCFVGLAQPIPPPHLSAAQFPAFIWTNEQVFTMFLSPDYKFTTVPLNCQRTISRFTGYTIEETLSFMCFNLIHPEDVPQFIHGARSLETTGESLGQFRCFRKNGGYIQIMAHSMHVDARGKPCTATTAPVAIISRNYVLNVFDQSDIVSESQVEKTAEIEVEDVPREASPEYPDGYLQEVGEGVGDLVPGDEMDTLEAYLQIHEGC